MPVRRRAAVHPLGDQALLIELGKRVDTALNSRAIALAGKLRRRRGVLEATPGYASVSLRYDPGRITPAQIERAVERLLVTRAAQAPMGRLHRVPVVYDGPDLEEAAQALGLPVEELIRLHTQPTYRCFMIGFAPGWAYLGPLPERLRLPRRAVPRTAVPAGTVAIAGAQTGIYPLPTPGGWHLLGRTGLPMFLPEQDPPSLFLPGDRVRFFAAGAAAEA
ncbi:MAG: 5-oxoprolinase subunit PxpB [Candidatus Dormibacteraceae bacterium]